MTEELSLTQAEIRVLKALASGLLNGAGATSGATSTGAVAPATDAELDSSRGDPVIRRDPKRWAGPSYVGARYSRCPSEYLICHAESLEFFANRDAKKPDPKKAANGTPYYEYDRLDAARARGWARRNQRKTFDPPAPHAPEDEDQSQSSYVPNGEQDGAPADDEIPF
jgi:hypothetical protein